MNGGEGTIFWVNKLSNNEYNWKVFSKDHNLPSIKFGYRVFGCLGTNRKHQDRRNVLSSRTGLQTITILYP